MTTNGKKRSNGVISHKVGDNGNTVSFTVDGVGTTELVIGRVHEDVKAQALMHGFIQRVRDAAAKPRNTSDGSSAKPEEKFAAMQELVEWYNSGSEQWSPGRTGSNALGGEKGLLLRVLIKVGAKLPEGQDVESWVRAKPMSEVKALLNSSKLKLTADELRAEGAAKVDGDALLSELGI